jgi:hypothetical protein
MFDVSMERENRRSVTMSVEKRPAEAFEDLDSNAEYQHALLNGTDAHVLVSPDQIAPVRDLVAASGVVVSFSVCEPSSELPMLVRETRRYSGLESIERELGRLAALGG